MKELYVPNKLCNKAVSNICKDFLYVRKYYNKADLRFFDCSNTKSIKIDLQDSMRIYINDDETADVITYGPGLQRDLSFFEVITEVIKK